MRWTYILFLPAVVAFFWAVATVFFKRRITQSQMLISLTLLIESAAIVMLAVYFRGHSGGLFIYNYIFKFLAVLCAPLFYLGICSLTEAKGVTMRQRRVMIWPLAYIVCLTAGAISIGWRRYEALCIAVRDGVDPGISYMYIVDHWVFPVVLILMGFFLIVAGTSKVWLYQKRFNDYYAQGLQVKPIDSRNLVVLSWIFLPLSVLTVFCIFFRPHYYKYWLIIMAVINTGVQWYLGLLNYRMDYDARSLAEYIREKNGMTENQ